MTIRDEGRRAFSDSSVRQFDLEYFERPETRKLVEPWGTPQRDDYDFKDWTRGVSVELLQAGCIYEYARESTKLRCLLVATRAAQRCSRHEYAKFDHLRARAITGLGNDAFDWLSRFADQLADNTSFRELLSTRRVDVKRSLVECRRLWPAGAITLAIRLGELSKIAPWPWDWRPSPGTSLEYPFPIGENMELLPERRILDGGKESVAIQIHWRDFTNKEIGHEMERFARNHRPKREDCREPSSSGRGPKPTFLKYLKALAVMRIWKRERSQWRRMELIAKTCGYRGCQRESAAYKKRCKEGRAREPMDGTAKSEMSQARGQALKVFKGLFPCLDEQPANNAK